MSDGKQAEAASLLDRYLTNLSVEVEPFALCMLDPGWRLSLPGPPCAMLHFVVKGGGWLLCPDRVRARIGPNWLVVIPTGIEHSLETRSHDGRELKIECTPSGRQPIEQVGSRCGFASRSHFSQAFKKHTGLSPAEFRERAQ